MYAELTLSAQNGLIQSVSGNRPVDPTVYAQIDHCKHNSAGAASSAVAMGVSTVPPPPSGYVRLPPVDQYQLIPYADNSSPSPSPSQYSASTQQVQTLIESFAVCRPLSQMCPHQLCQQVRWSRGEPETISVDSREADRTGSGTRSSCSAEATVISGNISSLPLINVQNNSEVQLTVPTSSSGWLSPVGTTRL